MINLKKSLCFLAVFSLLFLPCYSGKSYTITETELTTLESRLTMLQTITERQATDLQTLSQQLEESQRITEQQAISLQNVTQSLQICEKETVKAKIKIGAISICVGAGIGALTVALLR